MEKVVIGMSGGVDSAVSALLLKNEGYDVIALFMRNWDSSVNNDYLGNPSINNDICPQEQDYNDAKKVCEKLDIPLRRVDFIKEYWDYVFSYFLSELKKGRTPNPDVLCNKYIKFDLFIKEAKKLGADYVATGHYAITKDNRLYKGFDKNKDQSYFLSMLKPSQLTNVLFPVGKMTKEDVRRIAKENDLYVAEKKDSTGICFIGERHYQEFVKNYLKENPGDIIDIETKKVVGQHNGLMNYTIGQRKNVGLSGDKNRHYVCDKDVKNNILYVSFGEDNKYLYSNSCIVENMNYLNDTKKTNLCAKFRYRDIDHNVNVTYLDNNEILVDFITPVKAVTPGQVCALYDGEEVIGAGFIKSVKKNL